MRRGVWAAAVAVAIAASSATGAQTPAPAQASAAPQAPGTALTLASARDRVLVSNPTILAARARRLVAIAGVGVAQERQNPELQFEAARDAPKESVGFSLPIELGGKRQRRVDVANAAVATGEAEVDQIIAEVQNDLRRTYFEAVAADRLVTLAQDTRVLATRARDAAKARFDLGDVAQADVSQTELTLAAADDDLIAARGSAAAARVELNALLGQPADTPLILGDDLTAGPTPSMSAAIEDATSHNREILVIDRRIAEQTARRDLAKAQRAPDLTAGGGLTFNAQPEFAVGWRVNAGITLPLFTSHQAGVAVEDAELSRLQAERVGLVARITGSVAAALARLSAARERITHFQDVTLPLVADVERFAQVSYTAGQTPLSAWLGALQQTRDTRKNGLTASLDYQMALADLERAMGAPIR